MNQKEGASMKAGKVVLLGRPNVGKSTLLNNLVNSKISVTSPKPQTTRRIIEGFYNDDRGQIIFMDTPGVFRKSEGQIGKKINLMTHSAISQADLVLYIIDPTREKGFEENKIIGLVRKIKKPKILVINKIDILKKKNYLYQYDFLKEEFDKTIEVSALKRTHLKTLMEAVFNFLPEGPALLDPKNITVPVLNLSPEEFVAEIIRARAFLNLYQEIPYSITVIVEEIQEKEKVFYIKAAILTTEKRYQRLIIGKAGRMIKQIGIEARKEIETFVDKKVYLDLEVKVDPHWPEYLS